MTRLTAAARAALAIALIAGAACSRPAEKTNAPSTPPARDVIVLDAAAQKNAGVTIEATRTVTRADEAPAPGLVALDETRTARIGSLVDGSVVSTDAQIGDRVKSGQLLASLHSHLVHDAWAGYRKALADERRLAKELAFAIEAHERARRLFADKAIALQDLERADTNRVSAVEALDVARTEIHRSEDELEHLGITPEAATAGETTEQIPVRSPIKGVVLERLVTQGTAVTTGMPLFVVSDLSALWVLAEVDEAHISRVKVGRPVEVRVAAYPDQAFQGTVTFVGDTVSAKTRRIPVRCRLDNADGRLKPEMFATVLLGESDPRSVLAVPAAAVQLIDGRTTVFVAEAGGRFRPRAVQTGTDKDGLVEIRSGLAAGDRVAVGGSFVLKSELLKSSLAEE